MAKVETYIPLYRKYRPQKFSELIGQEIITQTLGNAIRLDKVAHAYLFCGPRGTGKTSTARIFAKSLNCEHGPTFDPCLTCASCESIALGNAIDVIEFDAASNNKVEDARELIEGCQFAPIAGKYKIYIIDEVHMLTTSAFNALLKTLEEPPPNVVFIFATTEAHKVLPTIISRCQRFDFTRIKQADIVKRLAWIADTESINIDSAALSMIARHARGGLRDAVGLLDQVAVLGRTKPDVTLTPADVSLFIGSLAEDVLMDMANAIAQRDSATLLARLEQLTAQGIEPTQLIKDIARHFRNVLVVKASGPKADPEALDLTEDAFKNLLTQAELFAAEELPQILSRLAQLEYTIRSTQQPQLWLEIGLVELAFRHDIHQVADLAERVAKLEAQLASGVSVATPASRPAPVQPQPARPAPVPQPAPPASPSVAMPTQPQVVPSLAAMAAAPPALPQAPVMPQPAPAAAVPPPPPAPSVRPMVSSSSGSMDWQAICQSVASVPTRSLLIQQTLLLGEEGDALTVGCRSEAILATLKKPEKFGHLQYAVDKAYGRPMVIKLVLDKTSAPPKQAAQQPAFAEPLFAGIPPVVPDAAPQMPAAPAMPHPGAIQTPQAPLAQPIAPMPPAYPDDMSVYDEFSVLPELPKPVAPALPPLEPISQASPQTAPQPVAVAAAAASPEPEAAVTNLEPGMMEDLKEAQGFTLELLNGRVLGT